MEWDELPSFPRIYFFRFPDYVGIYLPNTKTRTGIRTAQGLDLGTGSGSGYEGFYEITVAFNGLFVSFDVI